MTVRGLTVAAQFISGVRRNGTRVRLLWPFGPASVVVKPNPLSNNDFVDHLTALHDLYGRTNRKLGDFPKETEQGLHFRYRNTCRFGEILLRISFAAVVSGNVGKSESLLEYAVNRILRPSPHNVFTFSSRGRPCLRYTMGVLPKG
jgi:hypothetical protein